MNDIELHGHLLNKAGSRLELNTPVLIVDLDKLDRNIAVMAGFATANGMKLRPHAKTHKSPDIAKRQIMAGAVGQCCAKIGEAEALCDGDVTSGLLITSPVTSSPAISRLVSLNLRCESLMCAVDNPGNVSAIAAAAQATGKPLDVIIDVDPGFHRTGVTSPATALDVLATIRGHAGVRYRGVQFYCGNLQHIASYAERRAAVRERTEFLSTVIGALIKAGGPPDIVTGGGTGSHRIDAEFGVFTELQVGSYVFMDSQYLACELSDFGTSPLFETALMIDSRVISVNFAGMATVDAGIKAFSTDADPPAVLAGAPDSARYSFMGDEHGALVALGNTFLPLNTRITLAAPHCDPTVNLYDTYHVVQGDRLCALWPVAGRGRSR